MIQWIVLKISSLVYVTVIRAIDKSRHLHKLYIDLFYSDHKVSLHLIVFYKDNVQL